MKRVLVILAVLLIVSGIFTACASPTQQPSITSGATATPSPTSIPPSNLTVWMPPFGSQDTMDKEFWDRELKDFSTANNIDLTLEITPWSNYEEKYLTAVTSESGPDVGYMYIPMIATYINLGAVEPLDNYITTEDRGNFLYLDLGLTNGKQYGFPFIVGNPRILYCNMDILKKSGFTSPPKSWDELVAMGLKILNDSPDTYPMLQEWGDPSIGGLNSIYYTYLWSAGGEIFNDDGTAVAFDSEKGLKAAQFLYDLKFKYKILPDATTSLKIIDVQNAMMEGKVAMAVMGTSVSSQLDKAGINWDYTTALASADGIQAKTFIAVDSLVMLSSSKNKEMAAKAIKHMTSGPVISKFHKELCMFPPVGKDEQYSDNPKFAEMYTKDIAYFKPLPNVSDSYKTYDALYKNLQLMMVGQLAPEKALADAAAYAKTVIGK